MKAGYLLAVVGILAGSPYATAQTPTPAQTGGQYRVSQCLVTLIDEVEVPAREPGIITELSVKEGMRVKKGQQLGQVNDRDTQSRLKAAKSDLEISKAQAENEASVMAAEATVGVATAEYEKSRSINATESGAVSNFELERLRLTAVRSGYQAEVAKLEQLVAKLTWNVRAAQVESVENELLRRKIAAPLDGVLIRKYRDVGEWVNAGDPVCRVVRMDRLRVEGMVFAKHVSRAEIKGRPVSVEVNWSEVETPHSTASSPTPAPWSTAADTTSSSPNSITHRSTESGRCVRVWMLK